MKNQKISEEKTKADSNSKSELIRTNQSSLFLRAVAFHKSCCFPESMILFTVDSSVSPELCQHQEVSS
jgi:hypothetical protein